MHLVIISYFFALQNSIKIILIYAIITTKAVNSVNYAILWICRELRA